MPRRVLLPLFCMLLAGAVAAGTRSGAAAQGANRGTIKGRVRLSGKLPGNPVIRMGMDPMCAKTNAGKRVVQEAVVADLDGNLANVFVKLQGSFPQTALPTQPVTIDQRGCIYLPRVLGIRVGQTLEVKNSDSLLHNVHGLSTRNNGFNVSEPAAGMVQQFHPKDEEVMLRIKCDVHSWMTAYVGVVSHPYFAVSGTQGTFEITNVPAGMYTVQAWHERFGPMMLPVRVRAGAVATADFTYTGTEKPPSAGVHDLLAHPAMVATRFLGSPVLQ
jgi:plastocyanin